MEYVLLKAFKWSLGGKATHWLESQAPRSITTWKALYDAFLMKFFPPSKTTELRRKIASFQQGPNEPLFEAWDRFKEMLRQCPTHGQQPYVLQDIFFQGINPATKDKLNLHTDCGFIDLTPDQAWELLDKLSDYEAMYGVSQASKEVKVQGEGARKLYDPKGEDIDRDVKLQFLEGEASKLKRQVHYYKQNARACEECGSFAHATQVCPNESQVRLAERIEEANYVRGNFCGRGNFNNGGDGRWNNGQAQGYNNNFNQNEPRAPPPPYRPPYIYIP